MIDPYNELDHQRPVHMTETEYVSQMLTRIKRFAQHNDVHVWFVAHPRQLQGWRGEPPNLYDISGSAHFINKADNGVVIHRNRDAEQGPLNQACCPHVFCVILRAWLLALKCRRTNCVNLTSSICASAGQSPGEESPQQGCRDNRCGFAPSAFTC